MAQITVEPTLPIRSTLPSHPILLLLMVQCRPKRILLPFVSLIVFSSPTTGAHAIAISRNDFS